MAFPQDYMALYNASAHALKGVSSLLKVGGPATAGLDHLADFVHECKASEIPFDFISTHHVRARVPTVGCTCLMCRWKLIHKRPNVLFWVTYRASPCRFQYPTDGRAQYPPTPWHNACPRGENWDPDCFARQVKEARASVSDVKTFFLTECALSSATTLVWCVPGFTASTHFAGTTLGAALGMDRTRLRPPRRSCSVPLPR